MGSFWWVCAAILLSRSASVSEQERDLKRWAHAEGAPFTDAVTLAELPGAGRMAVATRDLGVGEPIISVPRKLMLCVTDVVDAIVLRANVTNQTRTRFIERALLEVFLASERGNASSFWTPFIAAMPREYDASHPFYSTKAAMHTVQSSDFGRTMRCAVRRTRKLYAEVVEFLALSVDWARTAAALGRQPDDYVRRFGGVLSLQHANATVSFEDFSWAHVSVISRIFGLNTTRTDDACLVPWADQLNHRSADSASAVWDYDRAAHTFVIKMRSAVARGAELTESYGARPNYRFLHTYGFVEPHNAEDIVSLQVDPTDINDDVWVRSVPLLRMFGIAPALPRRLHEALAALHETLHGMPRSILTTSTDLHAWRAVTEAQFNPCVDDMYTVEVPANLVSWLEGFPHNVSRAANDFLAIVVVSLETLPPDDRGNALAQRELQRTFLQEISADESDPAYPKRVWIERAMRLLRNGCTKKLLSYRTSIEQDAALLARDTALSFRIRMLVALRLEEKRSLRQCVLFSTNILASPELAGPDSMGLELPSGRSWPLLSVLAAAGALLILWALLQLLPGCNRGALGAPLKVQ